MRPYLRRSFAAVLGLVAFGASSVLAPSPAAAAALELDPAFSADGRVATDYGGGLDQASDVDVQPDGKLITAGGVGEGGFAVARYLSDGSLDPSFGSGGISTTSVGGHIQIAFAVARQDDGKLVAVGNSGDDFAVVRYNADGSLDGGFGSGGVVVTVFGGWGGARDVAIQPDGKIVVSGGAGGPAFGWALARYNTDGSLDPTFGVAGLVVPDAGTAGGTIGVHGLRLLPDGRILAAGSIGEGAAADFAISRYDADGSLDPTFGVAGRVVTDFAGAGDYGSTLTVLPGGSLLAAGFATVAGDSELALARYGADGAIDPLFGTGGTVVIDLGGQHDASTGVIGLGVTSDGRILAASCADCFTLASDFALVRLQPDGAVDPSGGLIRTDFTGGMDIARDLELQTDGKPVLTGSTASVAGDHDVGLARYLTSPEPFQFQGFFAPVHNPPAVNVVHAGSAVPVKFSLSGDQGLDVVADGYPVSQHVACNTGDALGPIQPTDTPRQPILTYDPATDRYLYLWKTKPTWKDTCRLFTLRLTDDTEHSALFRFP